MALSIWAASLAAILSLDDPRLRFPAMLAWSGLALASWLGLLAAARSGAIVPGVARAALVLGLAARAWALALPPALSEDVFRYVYEGRVVWWTGPGFPFDHPPAQGPRAGVPAPLIDEAWLRINHPEIPTIYPPLAQVVFAAAGGLGELLGGGHLTLLKLFLVAAELLAWLALARASRRPAEVAIGALLCPVAVLEIAREGHADSLAVLGLALGAAGFALGRPARGYLGFVLAALAKLNGLVVLPAALRETRRGAAALALLALLALPFLLAGPGAGQGLGEYATRWRAGDGAFSLLLAAAEAALGGDWARIAGATITRHQLARAFAAALFACWTIAVLRRPGDVLSRACALLLGLLLLSPTLHPWYTLWLLPFALLIEGPVRRASLALVAASVLAHHAPWLELTTGTWTDLGWVRALIHAPAWLLLVSGPLARRSEVR